MNSKNEFLDRFMCEMWKQESKERNVEKKDIGSGTNGTALVRSVVPIRSSFDFLSYYLSAYSKNLKMKYKRPDFVSFRIRKGENTTSYRAKERAREDTTENIDKNMNELLT